MNSVYENRSGQQRDGTAGRQRDAYLNGVRTCGDGQSYGRSQPGQETASALRPGQGIEAHHQPGHRGHEGHFAHRLPIEDPYGAGADAERGNPDRASGASDRAQR